MMRPALKVAFFVVLLLAVSLACAVTDRIQEIREDAGAVATGVEVGKEALGTGQAIATEFGESGIPETAQAVATEISESGIEETAQALVTEVEVPELSGEKPEDIPVIEEGSGDLVSSAEFVSYYTTETFDNVVDFYKREMPANGWTLTEENVSSGVAELTYEKGNRKASIVITEIPFVNQTTIVITITG